MQTPSHALLTSPMVLGETCFELQDWVRRCTNASGGFFNNGNAPSCSKAPRKLGSQDLFSGKGEERQSNYLPRQEDALCMSNQRIWTAEDISHSQTGVLLHSHAQAHPTQLPQCTCSY